MIRDLRFHHGDSAWFIVEIDLKNNCERWSKNRWLNSTDAIEHEADDNTAQDWDEWHQR